MPRHSLLLVVALACACGGGRPSRTPPTAEVVTVTVPPSRYPLASVNCAASEPDLARVPALFEVAGQATGGSLWALVFANAPFVGGRQVKIAWRVTGAGPLDLTARNLDTGATVDPFNGPVPHSSSSWNRPGGEWGSVWVFPQAGCWQITAARSSFSGTVRFEVITPPL